MLTVLTDGHLVSQPLVVLVLASGNFREREITRYGIHVHCIVGEGEREGRREGREETYINALNACVPFKLSLFFN